MLQYEAGSEKRIGCGGGYLKLLGTGLDRKNFDGSSEFLLMFGPDICLPSTEKVHLAFRRNKKTVTFVPPYGVKAPNDGKLHLYTLILRADDTFIIRIDGKEVLSGSLTRFLDFKNPEMIPDSAAKQPRNWDSRRLIPDPKAKKPDDWNQPEMIRDPDAVQPWDWNEYNDGDWEAGFIKNPDYKGEWRAPRIENPNYGGLWTPPMIRNPDFISEPVFHILQNISAIGFDLWQVDSGWQFDNIILTDDEAAAETFAATTFFSRLEQDAEFRKNTEL